MNEPHPASVAAKILIVASDATLCAFLRHNLEIEGHAIEVAEPAGELAAKFQNDPPDLVILDWTANNSAPGLCRAFRSQQETAHAHIIALTSPGAETERARELITRTLDHFVKPFSFPTLMERVRTLLNRATAVDAGSIKIGDIELDLRGQRLSRQGREIHLMPAEFRLLEFLMRNAGTVFSREQLVAAAWGRGLAVDERAIDVNIGRVRTVLNGGRFSDPIRTVRRRGYTFDTQPKNWRRRTKTPGRGRPSGKRTPAAEPTPNAQTDRTPR
jgi:two-component system, OmpR family, phosphate regulon response regulator PhoB